MLQSEMRPNKSPAPVSVGPRSRTEKQHLSDIKDFALLIKELLEVNSGSVISSRGKKVSPLVMSAMRYIKLLDSANCKVEMHYELYRELYTRYRAQILKCASNEDWMNHLGSVVDIQLGKGTSYESKNVTLKVSVACNNALKIRETIKNASYKNANDRELALGGSDFQYVALFHFRLLIVIRDSLDEAHPDLKKLSDLIEHYRIPAGMGDSEEDDVKPQQGEGISNFINGISGGKKIDGKGVVDAIEKVTSNTGMIDDITTAIKELNAPGSKKNRADVFGDLAKRMAPTFEDLFESATGQTLGGDGESSGSGSGSDESSE